MAIPSSGSITQNILSYHSAIIEPQKRRQLYSANGELPNKLINLLRMMGRSFAVPYYTYSAFEEGFQWAAVTVLNPVGSPGTGNAATVTLSVADHENGYSFPEVGELVKLNDVACRIQAKDESVATAHTLTLTPLKSTDNIGAISASAKIIVYSGASGAGTGQTKGKKNFPVERTFYQQIIKETLSMDGRTMLTPTYYDVYASDGKTIKGLWSKELASTEMRLEKKTSLAMLIGEEMTNSSLITVSAAEAALWGGDGVNEKVYTTKGLYTWGKERGYTDTVVYGAESVEDFHDIRMYLLSQGVTAQDIMFGMGADRLHKYNDIIVTRGNVGHDYLANKVKNMTGMTGLEAFFNVATYQGEGDVNFHLTELAEFSDPNVLNATGYTYSRHGIVFPLSYVKNALPSVQPGEILPSISATYFGNNAYSRELEIWNTGAAGGDFTYTNQVDAKQHNMRKDVGLFCMLANQIYIIED